MSGDLANATAWDGLSGRSRRFILAAILAAALLLRLWGIEHSFWVDEVLTYKRSSGTLAEAWQAAPTPLHHVFVHFALKIRDNEFFFRLPTLIAGLLGILAIYFVGRRMGGARLGLLAAVLLAFLPYHIAHSQDMRYYAIMAAAGMFFFYGVEGMRRSPNWRDGLLLIVAGWIGTLNHLFFLPYFALFAGLALALSAFHITMTMYEARKRGKEASGAKDDTTAGAPDGSIPSPRHLVGRVALLAVAFALALAPFVVNMWNRHEVVANLVVSTEDVEGPSSDDAHFLTLAFARTLTGRVWSVSGHPVGSAVMYVLFMLGFCRHVLVRRDAYAIMLGVTMIGVPLVLLFVPVSHWHHQRYYVLSFCIMAIFVAGGAEFIIDFASRWARRALPGGPVLHDAFWFLLLAAFLAPFFSGFLAYYHSRDREPVDWEELTQTILSYGSSDDLIVHGVTSTRDDGWRFVSRECLDFYLTRLSPPDAPFRIPREQVGFRYNVDAGRYFRNLDELIRANPERTIWIIDWDRWNQLKIRSRFDGVLETVRDYWNVKLHVAWAPYRNLIRGGDFERTEHLQAALRRRGIEVVHGEEAYSGSASIRAENIEAGGANFALAVAPDLPPLRDPDWSLWRSGEMDYWDASLLRGDEERSIDSILAACGPTIGPEPRGGLTIDRKLMACLTDSPEMSQDAEYEHLLLRQRIEAAILPGNQLQARLEGEWPENEPPGLRLALARKARTILLEPTVRREDDRGGELFVFDIPADAEREVAYLEVIVPVTNASSDVSTRLNRIDIAMTPGSETLVPGRRYVFSAVVHHSGIIFGDNRKAAGRIAVTGQVPVEGSEETKFFWQDLRMFVGDADWHRVVIPFQSGQDLPVGLREMSFHFGIYGTTGTIMYDEVQFTTSDSIRPYINGGRLPHDEALTGR